LRAKSVPTCAGKVSVSYLNGQFVALTDCGTIFTSTDGATWSPRQTGAQTQQASISAITYGNGQFVAVTASNIVTSKDGTNWVQHPGAVQPALYDIAYGNGQFVGLARDETFSTYSFFSSPDSTNWTLRFVVDWPFTFSDRGFNRIVYGNRQFIAVGGWEDFTTGASRANIATSPDGVNWAQQQAATTNVLHDVAYGNGLFVAIGGHVIVEYGYPHVGEDVGSIVTSTDGTNWVLRQDGIVVDRVAYGNGQFIAASTASTILASRNGINWTQHHLIQPSWDRYPGPLAYGNGHFIFCNNNGYDDSIWQSDSILRLSIAPSGAAGLLSLSLEGPMGLDYMIQSSTDLVAWTNLTNFTSTQSGSIISVPGASANAFYDAHVH
jgi:hypothetical protein